jgi:hypothetical protein
MYFLRPTKVGFSPTHSTTRKCDFFLTQMYLMAFHIFCGFIHYNAQYVMFTVLLGKIQQQIIHFLILTLALGFLILRFSTDIRDICKFTLSLGLLSTDIRDIRKFTLSSPCLWASFQQILEISTNSPCLHPVFGPPFTP